MCAVLAGLVLSLRDFHATVLGNGMTPLTELARSIEAWIGRSLL